MTLQMGAGSLLHKTTHTRQLPELASTVMDMCGIGETDVVWHCFCGSGELSLPLGREAEHVVAIGVTASEVSQLKRNLAANKVNNITAVLCNLRSPWTLKHLSFHISQSQQKRLLLGTGDEQAKSREYALTAFVPGESKGQQLRRLLAQPFTAPLLRKDAMASQELRLLLPAFVRDFRGGQSTMLVPTKAAEEEEPSREVALEMEPRLKALYRKLALRYHPDRNPDDPEASERFQALTRAYKALVGDAAGPEDDDEFATDPFRDAHNATYKHKFKHSWYIDPKEALGGSSKTPRSQEARDADSNDAEEGEGEFDVEFEAQGTGGRTDEESEEEDEYTKVKMEIDDAWGTGVVAADEDEVVRQEEEEQAPAEESSETEVQTTVVNENSKGIAFTVDGAPAMPSLPPPDVIVVSPPQHRVNGRGNRRFFASWLRSTAARTIVYVSTDAEAMNSDLENLKLLGYGLTKVQPFDPHPHRRNLLVVARLDLIRPLKGSEDYTEDGLHLPGGAYSHMLPGSGGVKTPLLGSGGYTQIGT
eukprot:TRINITY_DN23507_c0_g1_i7.p1 TRINITY_DN23507_c0_g1~~TRINITY_DN23507_c0_g1_i7.p1  ORF type:complete len:533 (-),score=120.18 TRINITY_DN23507_c0_g1_i7:495-2093(-)